MEQDADRLAGPQDALGKAAQRSEMREVVPVEAGGLGLGNDVSLDRLARRTVEIDDAAQQVARLIKAVLVIFDQPHADQLAVARKAPFDIADLEAGDRGERARRHAEMGQGGRFQELAEHGRADDLGECREKHDIRDIKTANLAEMTEALVKRRDP